VLRSAGSARTTDVAGMMVANVVMLRAPTQLNLICCRVLSDGSRAAYRSQQSRRASCQEGVSPRSTKA